MSAATGGSKTSNGYKYSFDGESLSQDLHMKMCKKIAQLTKVIYVLNTRNDEHDTELEELANKHKVELRQTVSQMTEKIEDFESRIKSQTGDFNKILELQDIIRSYEALLDQTKMEFVNYKEDASRSNKAKDVAHIEQLNQLNGKIASLAESYKDLYDDCEKMQLKLDGDKAKAVKETEDRYAKDIFSLKEEFAKKEKHLRDLVSGSQKEIEVELMKTKEEVKTATFLREKTITEYEEHIIQLRKSFEAQLSEALDERRKLMEFELEEANSKLEEFQNRSADKEVTMHSLIEKHLKELLEKDSEIEQSEKELQLMREDNKAKSLSISNYMKEVANLKEFIGKLETDSKIKKQEIDKLRKDLESLNGELQSKSKQLKDMKNGMETANQKLTTKDHELKEALHLIESMNEERHEMSHCTKSVSVDYEIQIQTLKRGLEELSNERMAERQALERLHMNHEIEQSELMARLKNEHSTEFDKAIKKLEKEYSAKEKLIKEEIVKLKEEMQMKIEEERNKASKMIEKLKLENEQIKTEVISKLKSKDKQISSNEATIADKEKEIKTLTLQNKSTKEKLSHFKKENDTLAGTVVEKDELLSRLTDEKNKLRNSLNEQVEENERIQKNIKAQMQEDMSEKYSQLSAELDKKWADTLRRENGRLRNDLMDNFAKEKDKILENAARMKNEEIACLQKEFEEINSKLVGEMTRYRDTIRTLEGQLMHEKDEVNNSNTKRILELEKRLAEEESSHLAEMSRIKDSHQKQLENMTKQFERDRSQYMSDMEGILETTDRDWKQKHDNSIKSITQEHEKAMKRQMDEIINSHNKEINNQIREVQTQMSEAHEGLLEDYKTQIKDLNHKVTTLEAQYKIQTENHRLELEKLRASKAALDNNYLKLEQSLQDISTENTFLKKEIDDFNVDYHRNQKEVAEKLKQKESDLKHYYEQILHNNKMTYEEDSKQTLQDFNKAQNLFKDKIKELNGRLLEVEEQYRNRPSRDEDTELIDTLKAQLRTSEKEIERMNEEKKFYKLELINRETNFNKIFNGSPNVGKVDPSQSAIKIKKSSNEKMKNFPKLTPLPGSPFHDDPINPARPLPPSRKSIDAS